MQWSSRRQAIESEVTMISKITNEEKKDKGVTGLPDTPELTTMQMQQRFDSLGNLAIDGFNRAADQLNSTEAGNSGASNIGATVPDNVIASGNIQSVLDALALLVLSARGNEHSHANKTVLDAITVDVKIAYDRIAQMLSAINAVENVVTNSPTAIPTSAGVHRLLSDFDYEALKLALYPIGTVYFSHVAISPETFIGGTWERETLIDGILSWRRTA